MVVRPVTKEFPRKAWKEKSPDIEKQSLESGAVCLYSKEGGEGSRGTQKGEKRSNPFFKFGFFRKRSGEYLLRACKKGTSALSR